MIRGFLNLKAVMLRSNVSARLLRLTTQSFQYIQTHDTSPPSARRRCHPSIASIRHFSARSAEPNRWSELVRVPKLVDGCDYEHWLVVVEPPKGYPLRDQIVCQYIATLAMALGSQEEAKKSIYSVSTKYYYAFGCKIPENLTHKIKSLPNVRWVLPDSYLSNGENNYGGEPFVEGDVVEYKEKYHANWSHDKNDDENEERSLSRKSRREKKKLKSLQYQRLNLLN
ncbi:multiple organellar RNA editing factor 7, mitochondrial [Diospyros lotus]|uniref:multiple organellar RNA editing factor 7, mitochondrial n=1 Tax=Diospyros lotus TaxID=55363 RepID=UPI002255A05C|nr:multiple organellar RNA editing factor 7, mitochondrial [Diospyros lotus]